jgi:hypothetical protein
MAVNEYRKFRFDMQLVRTDSDMAAAKVRLAETEERWHEAAQR